MRRAAFRTLAPLAAALPFALLAGCREAPTGRVGLVVPLSGPLAPWGHEMRIAVELALEDCPPERRPIVLQVDNGGSARRTSSAVAQLAEQGATALLGPLTTDNARAAGLTAQSLRLPAVVPAATGVQPGDGGFLFRTCASEVELATALARHAHAVLGLRRVAVAIDLSEGYSHGLAEAFTQEFRRLHGRIAGEVHFHGGAADVQDVLDRVAALEVQGALVAAYGPDLVTMLDGARDPRLADLVLLGGDAWAVEGLSGAVAGRVAGAYHARHFDPQDQDEAVVSFVRRWRERTGQLPGDVAALTYDAARLLFEVHDARAPGPMLREALLDRREVAGITGRISFDRSGAATRRTRLLVQVHDPGAAAVVARFGD